MRIYISCLIEYRFPSLTQHVVPGGNRTFTSGAKCLQPSSKRLFAPEERNVYRPKLSKRLFGPEERNVYSTETLEKTLRSERSEMFIDRNSRKDSSLRRSEMFIDRNSRKDFSLRRSDMFIAPKRSKRLFAPEERSAAKRHSKIRGYYKRIAPR